MVANGVMSIGCQSVCKHIGCFGDVLRVSL
jgi:hypothetical protein